MESVRKANVPRDAEVKFDKASRSHGLQVFYVQPINRANHLLSFVYLLWLCDMDWMTGTCTATGMYQKKKPVSVRLSRVNLLLNGFIACSYIIEKRLEGLKPGYCFKDCFEDA